MSNPTPNPTDNIDFLPAQYHERSVRRRSQPWHIVVVAAFVTLLFAAILSQNFQTRRTRDQLAAVTPMYDAAVARQNRLTDMQSQLHTGRTSAELFTYLRHPWPRTQLLAALVAPLPDEVTLDGLTISRAALPDRAYGTVAPEPQLTAEQQKQQHDALSPAARDLKLLRESVDKMQTVMLVSGTTTDSAVLHRYLGKLSHCRMFAKAEIDWIEAGADRTETSDATGGSQKFSATMIVRPGYGQPQGPAAPTARDTAARDARPRDAHAGDAISGEIEQPMREPR
ncbi:MAG: hypothetical protein HQ567_25210 [Candidatus Nealsonbacteria bacterium]|nr:hypothetical protein [Candidatus Nealsonbacteria bacterium]